MVSMKMSAREAQEYASVSSSAGDAPMYPYGLTVCLNSESMKKLGLDKAMPSVGVKMMLMATVEVTSVRQEKEQDGDARTSTDLQIVEMELMPKREEVDLHKMYPSMV